MVVTTPRVANAVLLTLTSLLVALALPAAAQTDEPTWIAHSFDHTRVFRLTLVDGAPVTDLDGTSVGTIRVHDTNGPVRPIALELADTIVEFRAVIGEDGLGIAEYLTESGDTWGDGLLRLVQVNEGADIWWRGSWHSRFMPELTGISEISDRAVVLSVNGQTVVTLNFLPLAQANRVAFWPAPGQDISDGLMQFATFSRVSDRCIALYSEGTDELSHELLCASEADLGFNTFTDPIYVLNPCIAAFYQMQACVRDFCTRSPDYPACPAALAEMAGSHPVGGPCEGDQLHYSELALQIECYELLNEMGFTSD